MEHTLIAVGKLGKKTPEAELLAMYIKRLPWKIAMVEVEAKKAQTDAARHREENAKVRAAIPAQSHIIALDPGGAPFSSEHFAQTLMTTRDRGHWPLAFLIGGADGLDHETLNHANLRLSFGPMIWPHMLARVMLAEQLFRAHCIMSNHPYHRA